MVGSYWVCHCEKTFWVGGCDGIESLAYLLFCAAYWSRQPRVFQWLSRSCSKIISLGKMESFVRHPKNLCDMSQFHMLILLHLFYSKIINRQINLKDHIEGILPKGPYPPCLRMADRALLAGYPQCLVSVVPGLCSGQMYVTSPAKTLILLCGLVIYLASWNLVNMGSGNGLFPDSTKALPTTNVGLSSVGPCVVGLEVKMLMKVITTAYLKITHLRLKPYPPGANESIVSPDCTASISWAVGALFQLSLPGHILHKHTPAKLHPKVLVWVPQGTQGRHW